MDTVSPTFHQLQSCAVELTLKEVMMLANREPQVFPDGLEYWLGMPTFLHARCKSKRNPGQILTFEGF